jgi:hypothetical protein
MGGTSTTTTNSTQSSALAPYEAARQQIDQILGGIGRPPGLSSVQAGALDQLAANAAAGNRYAPALDAATHAMLVGGTDRSGMVSSNLDEYRTALDPTVRGDFLDPNKNSYLGATTEAITKAAADRVRAEYAAARGDPTGAGSYAGQVGSEVAKALAPTYASLINTERDRALSAAGNRFAAGNTATGLLGSLEQQRFANQVAGADLSRAALAANDWGPLQALAAEAMRQRIPLDQAAQAMGILLPSGQAFGTRTSTGKSTTENEMSDIDKFVRIAGGLGSLFGGGGRRTG